MDSGNSGSLQSSSGGDDEFDSRCGAGAGADDSSSSPLAALLLRHHHPSSPFAASLVYGLHDDLATQPLSHWSSATETPIAAAEAPPSHGQQVPAASAADQIAPPPPPPPAQAQAQPTPPPRGSRKRARASRRAPTTVLTTDTSNFRAMVQEFTGIPAPPFAAASASARSRFDHLFPSRASALPPYLLRPFATGKLHAPATAYQPPSTSSPAPAGTAIAPPAAPSTAAVPSRADDDTYRLAPSAPPALLGMPQDHHGGSSYLSFQSALGAHLDGGAKYLMLGRGIAPPSAPRLQDPDGFLGLTTHAGAMGTAGEAHLHPRNGDHGGDELSGLVAFGTGTSGGCKAVYSSAPPLLARSNGQSPSAAVSTAATAPAMAAAVRTQGADSWICTSE